ncbi:MAG TPA: hypothetical protein VMT52_09210 [Planctomycetota bacterium]|nr:hypothetical protein [Planctomycetota bacterium]
MTHDEIADKLIDWATTHKAVRALWIEGADPRALRRPYGNLELHIAADEPDFPALLEEVSAGLPPLPGSRVLSVADTQRFAKELAVEAGGSRFLLIVEQTNLLAKRPRAEVVPFVDKTRHLTHVMDFSRRKVIQP